jgi:hypothetical protein
MPGARLTDVERGRIIERSKMPRSTVRALMAHFKRSRPTILRVLGRLRNARRLPATGACHDERDRKILALAGKMKTVRARTFPAFPSSRTIAKEMTRLQIPCSHNTVARVLRAHGLKPYVRPRVPTVNPAVHAKRLAFCTFWDQQPDAELARIVFSDEHWLDTNDHTARSMWATSKEAVPVRQSMNPLNLPSLMIWAAIGVGWRSPLVFVHKRGPRCPEAPRGMDAKKYVRCCLARVAPTLVARRAIFQQDGARPHVAHHTSGYIERKGIERMENWPPYSPDLNPIEQMWPVLDAAIARLAPDSHDSLQAAAIQAWAAIPQALIDNTVLSFRGKVGACRAREGRC